MRVAPARWNLDFDVRIVSLLPSATEMVYALGAGEELVAVSHECDHPPEALLLPALTSARIPDASTSAAIDRAVREVLKGALSIYRVDEAELGRIGPEVIITQDLCEVCAVSLDDVKAAVARLAHRDRVEIVSLSPTRWAQVLDDLEKVGAAIGRADRARSLRAEYEARIQAIQARTKSIARRPRVVTIEWLDPLMLGGTWMPELITFAGGDPIGAEAGAPAPTITVEQLRALAPDVVVIKPCGFSVARSQAEPALLEAIVAHAPGARVWLTDGNAYFNRPGPRLVESTEILAACIHPGIFPDFAERHASAVLRLDGREDTA